MESSTFSKVAFSDEFCKVEEYEESEAAGVVPISPAGVDKGSAVVE